MIWEITTLRHQIVIRLQKSPTRTMDNHHDMLLEKREVNCRIHQQEPGYYSWWDYRNLGFQTNNGLRIDYLFVSENLSQSCDGAYIDREQRKGLKPSDHAPVLASFIQKV